VAAEFAFDPSTLRGQSGQSPLVFSGVAPGRTTALPITGRNGHEVRVVLLNEADSLALAGAGENGLLTFDTPQIIQSEPIVLELLKNPKGLRDWKSKDMEFPLPVSPGPHGFQTAAVWKVKLPPHLDLSADPILRIHYTGDAARLTLNGRLLNDDFYNGNAFENRSLAAMARRLPRATFVSTFCRLQEKMPVYSQLRTPPDIQQRGNGTSNRTRGNSIHRLPQSNAHCINRFA
jgi:hypothetical protein